VLTSVRLKVVNEMFVKKKEGKKNNLKLSVHHSDFRLEHRLTKNMNPSKINVEIKKALEKQRDELFNYLGKNSLSEFFKQEWKSIKDGTTALIGDVDKDTLEELKQLGKDKSYDKSFQKKVQGIKALNNDVIFSNFEKDITKLLGIVASKKLETELQAIFLEYDYYYDYKAVAVGYGLQIYPTVTEPQYLTNEVDLTKALFEPIEAIDFEEAWADCEEFEWTNEFVEIYYQLLKLYQLNLRVLLHEALERCFQNGQLDFVKVRPFTIYVNEHDCEVMTLYRID
jgi:hypothetical protein